MLPSTPDKEHASHPSFHVPPDDEFRTPVIEGSTPMGTTVELDWDSTSEDSYTTCSSACRWMNVHVNDIESQFAHGIPESASLDTMPDSSLEFSILIPSWTYGMVFLLIMAVYSFFCTLRDDTFKLVALTATDFILALLTATFRYFFALHPLPLKSGDTLSCGYFFRPCGLACTPSRDFKFRVAPVVFLLLLVVVFFVESLTSAILPSHLDSFTFAFMYFLVRTMKEFMVGSIRNFLPFVPDPSHDTLNQGTLLFIGRVLFMLMYSTSIITGLLFIVGRM